MDADASTRESFPDWDALYAVAQSQLGYFTTQQAAEAGYSSQLLYKYLDNGRITRVRRGIYRLVHFPASEHEELVVLWLWADQTGVFSHATALALHDLSDVLPSRVHMTLPAQLFSGWARTRSSNQQIATLVLNPLLLNFRGNLPEYLEQKADSEEEELKAVIRGVLEDLRGGQLAGRGVHRHPGRPRRPQQHHHRGGAFQDDVCVATAETVILRVDETTHRSLPLAETTVERLQRLLAQKGRTER